MPRTAKINKIIRDPEPPPPPKTGWIPMGTGLVVITIASLLMGGLTAVQLIPQAGVVLGILYGLFFAGMVWMVFLVSQAFFRWLKKP